jgi:hypothetical protein
VQDEYSVNDVMRSGQFNVIQFDWSIYSFIHARVQIRLFAFVQQGFTAKEQLQLCV